MRINEKEAKRMIGKKYKIVTREPGEKRNSTVIGIIEDFESHSGFFIVDSESGLAALNSDYIISMKKTF